jgi:uncharacterized protein with PIN domain
MADNENHEIKYSVTAVIDLLGFANHLEIEKKTCPWCTESIVEVLL